MGKITFDFCPICWWPATDAWLALIGARCRCNGQHARQCCRGHRWIRCPVHNNRGVILGPDVLALSRNGCYCVNNRDEDVVQGPARPLQPILKEGWYEFEYPDGHYEFQRVTQPTHRIVKIDKES